MTTISVPLPMELEKELNNLVKSGYGSNKADVVRRAIKSAAEEEAIQSILTAQKEIVMGKGLSGDLRKLSKMVK
ncbi:MAG: ribbon-helix-helix domain-containing protein [Candidatus Pacebacteria bacterium]|nr:ribbon-helix-helix domain-containing protein [Candidatus Paceibacterota bacterium]